MQFSTGKSNARASGRLLTLDQRLKLTGFLFLLPSLLLFCAFQFYPIAQTVVLSFFKYDLLTPKRFVGLGNFADLMNDAVFWATCGVTVVYVLGTYVPVFLISLGLGLALRAARRMQGPFRTIFFTPNVVSIIAICVVWKLIFHPSGLSATLTRIFTPNEIAWLHHPRTAQTAVIVTNIWREVGYFTVLFLAGLLGIPREYYEAASVDGAGSVQAFFWITVPLLRRTIVFVTVLCVVRGIQTFAPQFIMTRGGPGIANTPLALAIYNNAFQYFKMGKASAMAIILGAVAMALTYAEMRLFGEQGGY